LDLDLASGELVLLLGASGCGKTTLLSVLAGILSPTSGTARFGVTDITALRGRSLVEYRRHGVGVVFQAFNLMPSLPAIENVMAPMWAAGMGGAEARRRATTLLSSVGLADRLKNRPGDLSGGQQQRVAIARALALDPPLVLADEPTAHLDAIQVESVLQLLRDLARPGRLVVVATHDERLLPLADRVVELSPRRPTPTVAPTGVNELSTGEVLFRQGAASDYVYVVEAGRVELVRELAGGGEEVVFTADPGRWFGEIGPTYGLPRTATARAAGTATVRPHTVAEFRRHLREPPESS
jgi:putative ABC transport system ATP-binding protein